MSRFARERRVYFYEEPVFEGSTARLAVEVCPQSGVRVLTPTLPAGLSATQVSALQRELLQKLITEQRLEHYAAWFYTPMAMEFTSVLDPVLTVYDCMDELTGFAGAPVSMKVNEEALFHQAELVFTGGASLYEAKRRQHKAVYLFPSSVDVRHFAKAQQITSEPADQGMIARPRIGYAGVIDERMDLNLLTEVARQRPAWQFILLGPVVKINPASLPSLPNLHLLGMKKYADLPAYLAGWDAGMLPFALNEATRFISPTKTPEYLAAGLRVISTPIRDVVHPYGELGLVEIAGNAEEFIVAMEKILAQPKTAESSLRVGEFLKQSSWDKTWSEMEQLMKQEWVRKFCGEATGVTTQPAALLARGIRNV